MKNSGCIAEEKLPIMAELPPDDPARRHLTVCARCRSRVAAIALFISPKAPPDGCRPDEADAHLTSILDREIYGGVAGNRARPIAQTTSSQGGIGSILRYLWRPSLRPVWAVGLVLLAILGTREIRRADDDRIILREEGRPTASSLVPAEPVVAPDGRVMLRWSPMQGTTHYMIVLLGEDHEERERLDTGTEPSCTLDAEDSASLRAGNYPFWRVIALRDGDPIGSSKTTPLTTPRTP